VLRTDEPLRISWCSWYFATGFGAVEPGVDGTPSTADVARWLTPSVR
jgi:hypothetical protein